MPHILISAAHKSSGKTTVCIGLCAALRQRNIKIQPFKKGPDYIDPMWLTQAAGRACHNLDFYTQSPEEIRANFYQRLQNADIGLIEGNKGLYDGLAIDGSNSNAALSILLRPKRDALGFGVGDLSTELSVERIPTYENPLFQQILGIIAMTGKRYYLDLFDSVSARFNDPEIVRREAQLSCKFFGYTGKKLINPKQLEIINQVFAPPRAVITDQLYTIESFLSHPKTNAHVVKGEYKGMPAFKAAERYIKKLLRQGYLGLVE